MLATSHLSLPTFNCTFVTSFVACSISMQAQQSTWILNTAECQMNMLLTSYQQVTSVYRRLCLLFTCIFYRLMCLLSRLIICIFNVCLEKVKCEKRFIVIK